jgi:hypothetical protein
MEVSIIYTYICVYMYIYVYIYIYVHVYMYMYIHTYIYAIYGGLIELKIEIDPYICIIYICIWSCVCMYGFIIENHIYVNACKYKYVFIYI